MQPWPERLSPCARATISTIARARAVAAPTPRASSFSRRRSGRGRCASLACPRGIAIRRVYGRLEQVPPAARARAAAIGLRPAAERDGGEQPDREDDPTEHATDPATWAVKPPYRWRRPVYGSCEDAGVGEPRAGVGEPRAGAARAAATCWAGEAQRARLSGRGSAGRELALEDLARRVARK